jgi:c-di-GMP-binding flagellar brake protein YcgR
VTDFQERRRFQRVAMTSRCELRASRRVRVRLLDVSAGGALVASDEPLAVGVAAHLRLSLGGAPFETPVTVQRDEPAPRGGGRRAGIVMRSMPASQQDILEEFLSRAGC